MPRSVWDLLLESLEDLDDDQFKKFTSKLTDSQLEPRVRRAAVQGKDRGDVARKLVDTFTERRALGVTVRLLKEVGYNQVAEDLEKEAAGLFPEEPQQPLKVEPNNPPPTNPKLNSNSTLVHCTPQFKAKILKEKGGEIYPVLDKAVRKRLALLINNVEFDDEKMTRNGAQRDEENMEKLLMGLGYDVVNHTNLSGQEMDKALKSFAGRREHAKSDSTFVVIMSHGMRDKILGVHYRPEEKTKPDIFPMDNIYTHLNTANCPALRDKPKVILIQACRGETHGRVWVSDSHPDEKWNFESDGVWEHKEKDFVSLLSCTPDTVSFRHSEKGALFIRFLVEVFNTNAHVDHIEELFRQVMRRFENFQNLKQMPSKDRISLAKSFYLFPGL